MRMLFPHTLALTVALTTAVSAQAEDDWHPLFNGKNLDGWTAKFTGQPLGVNYKGIFRAGDGILKVGYDNLESFKGEFGHLFYQQPFSSYRLRLEYRFHGDQVSGGPKWAFRNSGVMIHAQAPVTMALDQDFPASIEVQFLGQTGEAPRPTGNLCTPGTHVMIAERLEKNHCISSSSPTFAGNGWVQVEVEVSADGQITHYIKGEPVLRYHAPQLDPDDPISQPLIKNDVLTLGSGYIALQAESHPVDFRNIEIKVTEEAK